MAESVKPVGAIALDSRLAAEEAGYSDDSTAKPILRKKKTTRKRLYGESTYNKYNGDIKLMLCKLSRLVKGTS